MIQWNRRLDDNLIKLKEGKDSVLAKIYFVLTIRLVYFRILPPFLNHILIGRSLLCLEKNLDTNFIFVESIGL